MINFASDLKILTRIVKLQLFSQFFADFLQKNNEITSEYLRQYNIKITDIFYDFYIHFCRKNNKFFKVFKKRGKIDVIATPNAI